jgi:hypothetical protein
LLYRLGRLAEPAAIRRLGGHLGSYSFPGFTERDDLFPSSWYRRHFKNPP